MPWLYIIIFLLISTGLLSLFGVHVTDLLTIFSKSKSVTLSDELKVVMGIPVKGFFNREYELGEMLRSMGRAENLLLLNSCLYCSSPWAPCWRCC